MRKVFTFWWFYASTHGLLLMVIVQGDFLFMREVFDQFARFVDKQKQQGLLVPKQKDSSSAYKVEFVESAASLVPVVLSQHARTEEAELLASVSALVKMAASTCRITTYEAVNAIAKLSSSGMTSLSCSHLYFHHLCLLIIFFPSTALLQKTTVMS